MTKFTICVFINFIFTIAVNGQDGAGYCAKPIVEAQNIIDIKFIHDNFKQGWNTQFGNSVLRKRVAQLLQGKDSPEESESSKLCLKASIDFQDEHHIIGYVTGFGGLSAKWNCTDSNHIYECTLHNDKNGYKDSGKVFMVYFDGNEGHNSLGLAFCYPDGTVGWFVNSISKTLTDKETKVVLDRFKSVGFDPALRVPLRSETCP